MNVKQKILEFLAPVVAVFNLSVNGRCLWTNKRATNELAMPVTILIGGLIWAATIPAFVEQIQATNTTGWTFTGYAGAIVLYGLTPFAMIAGAVIWILKKVL